MNWINRTWANGIKNVALYDSDRSFFSQHDKQTHYTGEHFGSYDLTQDGFLPNQALKPRATEREAKIFIVQRALKDAKKTVQMLTDELNQLKSEK